MGSWLFLETFSLAFSLQMFEQRIVSITLFKILHVDAALIFGSDRRVLIVFDQHLKIYLSEASEIGNFNSILSKLVERDFY